MIQLQRGQKISIQTVCRTWSLEVVLRHQGPLAVDVSCFGLDSAGRLSDERYFLFYNQRRSPEGAMALSEGASGGTARFQVDLAARAGPVSSGSPSLPPLTAAAPCGSWNRAASVCGSEG